MKQRRADNIQFIHTQRPVTVDRHVYMRQRAAIAAQLLARGMSINDVARRLNSSRPFVQRVIDAQMEFRSRKTA